MKKFFVFLFFIIVFIAFYFFINNYISDSILKFEKDSQKTQIFTKNNCHHDMKNNPIKIIEKSVISQYNYYEKAEKSMQNKDFSSYFLIFSSSLLLFFYFYYIFRYN